MAKRKEKPAEEGSPAWMATFSDLMNLLLCFFVLLFASSTTDAEKIQRIVASFNNSVSFSFMEAGSISLVEGQIVSGGVSQLPGIHSVLEYIGISVEPNGNSEELNATGADEGKDDLDNQPDSIEMNENEVIAEKRNAAQMTENELKERFEQTGEKQSQEMYDEISKLAESYDIIDRIDMDFNAEYVSLDLNGAILFDAGKADIRQDANVFMQKVATILGKYKDCIIEIEGHTDNVPIHNSEYESNRYLSTARATKVYEYVMDKGDLIDENMKVAGYGESRPVASNKTEEGRAKNRRVTIKIYNRLNSNTQS